MSQTVLTNGKKSTILVVSNQDGTITIGYDYAKQRHDQAMAEVQFWRKVMGLEPIQTGAMQRRTAKQAGR